MKYQKEVLLKDGTKCLLRGAGERDAAEILRCFHLTHAETDYLLTYPEENLFTEADEAKFLKASEESANAIEIGAFVNGKVVGSAGIEPLGDKEKLRHRADFGIAVAGKTGTAENADHSDNLTFIGFAPYENPEIAVAVVIEYGGKGDAAKETAKAVFEAYFAETLQKEAKNAETTVTEGAE